MKKLFITPIIATFISCGYSKDHQIYSPIMDKESYYMVRVFGPSAFTNSGALIIYKSPMSTITDKKVDSINNLADKYIEDCKRYTEN